MSTIVCQNITTTLKLKVAAAPCTTNSVFGSWDFLQSIPPPKEQQSIDHEKHFYSATKKSSFSTLSAKSLELCTENLGSESGSHDIITADCSNSIFSSIHSSNSSNQNSSSASSSTRKLNPRTKSPKTESRNFPPPLSSMSSMQVRRHTEGGRLIIEAVETPFRHSYLQAERSDGRLRLCFLTRQTEQKQEQEQEQEQEQDDDNNINVNVNEEEEEEVESEDELEKEEMNTDTDTDDHMGFEKYQRLIRCSHGNEGLHSSWKPSLWVAIS